KGRRLRQRRGPRKRLSPATYSTTIELSTRLHQRTRDRVWLGRVVEWRSPTIVLKGPQAHWAL
ncbi:MAG: hypothetical protein ACTHQQ_22995, partial [Solirubrobacteraceae bacterium]